jgi:NADH dehydrogenase
VHLSGLPAWILWALIHVLYLVQFQSRIVVFIKWGIQDLTFNRGSRLITETTPTDLRFENDVGAAAPVTPLRAQAAVR